jgi:hypothetical protein
MTSVLTAIRVMILSVTAAAVIWRVKTQEITRSPSIKIMEEEKCTTPSLLHTMTLYGSRSTLLAPSPPPLLSSLDDTLFLTTRPLLLARLINVHFPHFINAYALTLPVCFSLCILPYNFLLLLYHAHSLLFFMIRGVEGNGGLFCPNCNS